MAAETWIVWSRRPEMMPVLSVNFSPSGCPITNIPEPSCGVAIGCTNSELPECRPTQSRARSRSGAVPTTAAEDQTPEAVATIAWPEAGADLSAARVTTWLAVANRYPDLSANSSAPAPNCGAATSWWFHSRTVGDTTITSGFNCSEASELVRTVFAGSVTNWFRSSRSGSPVLTMAGTGTKETTTTAATVENRALTISSVDMNETQA